MRTKEQVQQAADILRAMSTPSPATQRRQVRITQDQAAIKIAEALDWVNGEDNEFGDLVECDMEPSK